MLEGVGEIDDVYDNAYVYEREKGGEGVRALKTPCT